MSQQDLLRTIHIQAAQLNQLRDELGLYQNSTIEAKYKKALKEIGDVVKANRQLKLELDKLNEYRNAGQDNFNRINQQQISKAYEKVLKQKNQLMGQNQSLALENQKLRKNIFSLEGTLFDLKNEKMTLAREKEALTSKLNLSDKGSDGFSDKFKGKDSKQKQVEFKRTVDNLEQRNSSLQKTNRKLEEQISQLENKIFNIESEYKNRLMEKQVELKTSKMSIREEYQLQIISLKKQAAQLKSTNNDLMMRFRAPDAQRSYREGPNQYDEQLIQTLRDLKLQIEPMSAQIAQLQDKNESQRDELQRQRANLQIKVIQYSSQIQRLKQNQKILQGKLIKQTERLRKWQDSQRTIKKLEQQNRMLGGRVIVLQAKEVALRNRSGDELQERVLEFQTRVEMLLNDKQTISNMKNIGIHQLIALKAYVMQLDAKLKQVVNQNEYAVKKYKSYKQKCTQLIRQLKQHDIAINALKGKLQGYDRLVVKLQGQLERAITINDNQVKAMNVKITQSTMNSIQIYKKRYQSLLEKLSLQEKYAEQQIQTLKLNYDTKILDLNLKLEQLSSVRETIGLYKSKNQQLSTKLTQRQNQLLQTKMTKVVITDTVPQVKNPHKDTINKLHETINLKESTILSLQNQIRKTELEWKGKYSQLEQTANASLSKKSREQEEKQRQIQILENEIKNYRSKINQLESKTIHLHTSKSDDQLDFKKTHHFTGQISDLQVQLQDLKNRYEIENSRVGKLNKLNAELKQTNNDLESEISKLRFEIKRIQKQMQLEIEDKNTEIKRLQSLSKTQQNYLDTSRVQKSEPENNFKINSLRMQLQMAQGQLEQLERDKSRYYNRSIELQREVSQLNVKIQQINYTLERTKNNISNDLLIKQTEKEQEIQKLLYNLRTLKDKNAELQDRILQYQSQLTKVRNELLKERQKLLLQNDGKQQQISRLMRELNRVKADISNHDDVRSTLEQQYEYKLNRIAKENNDLRDQINRIESQIHKYQSQIKFLKNRELQYNNKAQGQQNYLIKISADLRALQNKEVQLQSENMEKDSIISKLTNQLNYIRSQIESIETTIQSKDSYIQRLNVQLNTLKNNQIQWEIQVSTKANQHNKIASDLNYARNKIEALQHENQSIRMELNRLKAQNLSNQHNYSNQISEIQDRQMVIMRLQTDLKAKVEQIHDLEFQLTSKNSKLSDLQTQSNRLRSVSTELQSQLMQKNSQISRLNYDLNNIRIKYDNLQQEHSSADNNFLAMNRELANIRAQIGNYEDDLAMKDMTLERYKNDVRDLTQQIQRINQEIFEKNKIINNLNQEVFRLKLDGEQKSSDRIYKLQNEIYQLKSKVSSLQNELDVKQEQLGRARLQVSQVKSNITINRYSDEEYDLLQAQFYQVQKSLTETRSLISEKDLEIAQLQAKIQYMKKLEVENKKRFNEQRNDLETQLQNILNRQRQLRNQVENLQNKVVLQQNRNTDQQKWGLHLYQQECDRLQKIVQQLQNQVNSLKLKLTYMTNQEDRIIENLTIMTLTFAQVEALRERMKIKQNQISEVRKSLINFASSSEEITSMGSRMLVRDHGHTSRSGKSIDKSGMSIQQIESNVNQVGYANPGSFKKSQKMFHTQQIGFSRQANQSSEFKGRTQYNSNYQSEQYKYEPDYKYKQQVSNDYLIPSKIANNTISYEYSNQTGFNNTGLINGTKPVSVESKYKTEDFEQQIHEPNEEDEWNQYSTYQKNAQRKLNQLVDSMTGEKQQSQKDDKSKKSQQIYAVQQITENAVPRENVQQKAVNIQTNSFQGQQQQITNGQNELNQQNISSNIQTNLAAQTQQVSQVQQASQNISQTQQASQNVQISQSSGVPQVQTQFSYNSYQGQIQTQPQSLSQPSSQTQISSTVSPQIPSVSQPQNINAASWRYGSSQGSQSMTAGNIQNQANFQTIQTIQTSQQRTSQVRFGTNNPVPNPIPINTGMSGNFGVVQGPTPMIPVNQVHPQSVQFHSSQSRPFGILQQPLQYPGFAR